MKAALLSALIVTASAQVQVGDLARYFPRTDETGTWERSDSIKAFAGDDLFSYIDGGADMYLEYGFIRVAVCRYWNKSGNSLIIELYEMKDPGAAYGVYSMNASPEGKEVPIGNEGSAREYYLQFWKGRFLAYVIGNDTSSETKDGIISISRSLDRNIPELGNTPPLVNLLPTENLIRKKYVRGSVALSSIYNFDGPNIFGLEEGAVGEYPGYTIFLFVYPSASEAGRWLGRAAESLKRSSRLHGFTERNGVIALADKKEQRLCIGRIRTFILIALTKEGEDVETIFSAARRSLESNRSRGE